MPSQIQAMRPSKLGPMLSRAAGCAVLWEGHVRDFYSVDASSYIQRPLVVAFPRNERDVTKIVKFAKRHGIPVTPRGAGTGLVGSALGRGIIIDMRHFDRIAIGSGSVTVGSGVPKGRLDRELKKKGRFIGPDPSIGPFCTIGGMIGTNASGVHSLKYGSVIDNLIEIRMVDASGRIVKLPGKHGSILDSIPADAGMSFPKVSKNSCGYRIDRIFSRKDLHKVIAGSEGTLGIIVSAKIRTYASPKKVLLYVIHYKTLHDAARDVAVITRLKPSALELVDSNIIKHIKIGMPSRTGCLLFVEFDDMTGHRKSEICSITSGRIIRAESDRDKIKELWSFRNSALAYSLRSIRRDETMPTLIEDAVVPVRRLPLLLSLLDMISRKYGLRMITYGHAGNGNLHIRPVLGRKDTVKIREIASEFFAGVIGIGGSITGEHGDGLARSEFVKMQYGKKTYSVFKRIKKEFDPYNILNPGKIISNKSTMTRNLKF